jgi:glucosyl-3-phosphoglycerate synthase
VRTYHHADFRTERAPGASACLPARNCEETVGAAVRAVAPSVGEVVVPHLRNELVVFLDADLPDPPSHYAPGLLGPLLAGEADFVKAFYRRPLGDDPEGGGRVNHLMARPALRVFFPELRDVRQPLAGEVAARRELLERVGFADGYGVEIGMLIDVWRAVGLDRMAQVDLGVMDHHHQPLRDLTDMAETVLRTVVSR